MRNTLPLVFITVLAPLETFAGTEIQTDWSGGGGILGPFTDWGNVFYADTDVECYRDSTDIALLKTLLPEPLSHVVDEDYTGGHFVCSSDLNGDGCMDVIGAAYWDGDVTWWENADGVGTSWTQHVIHGDLNAPASVCSEDVNNDGYIDVIAATRGGDQIIWWENSDGSGTAWTEYTVDSLFDGSRSVYAQDINGDGYMDILGAAENAHDIAWWENLDGTGNSWTKHEVDGNFFTAVSVYSADMNEDGFMDVLGAAETDRDITWWENADSIGTSWVEHTVDGDFYGAVSVYSSDINGDGFMDVLGAAYNGSNITWWENTDSIGTSWVEHPIDAEFAGAYSVRAADFNNDGYMDVLGAAQNDNDVTWWENSDGSGTSWIEHLVDGDFTVAIAISAADINSDGYVDIVGASLSDRPFAWWDLTEYVPEGLLESSVLDVQENPDWQTIDWTSTEPAGTTIAFQVRASDDFSSMGIWSDTLSSPCSLDGILADSANYIQYRTILSTTDSLLSPILHDVTVEWYPYTGTHQDPEIEVNGFELFGATPNPAKGHAAIAFALPIDSTVELLVYDLSGRSVRHIDGVFEPGMHEVLIEGLASGVYLVRMTSDDFTSTRQFVVLD